MPAIASQTPRYPTGPAYVLGRGPWWDVGFWLAYGLMSHIVFAPETFEPGNLLVSAILTGGQAGATYLHLRYLLRPRLVGRIGIAPYVLGLLLIVITAVFLLLAALFFLLGLSWPLRASELGAYAGAWLGPVLGGVGMALAITAGLFLYGRHREQEQREVDLKANQQATELAYLRGQLNPHFLFNAINSIYVLIPRDADRAQSSLAGLADLLRYQLYQSELATVPLADELSHLEKFAELHRLRAEEDFHYTLLTPGNTAEGKIPPMLLLPLLENAFKYSPNIGARVEGSVTTGAGRLSFHLCNRVAAITPARPSTVGGIGVGNIRRRLELLFPGDHTFTASAEPDQFTVHLEIPLQ